MRFGIKVVQSNHLYDAMIGFPLTSLQRLQKKKKKKKIIKLKA